MNFYTNEHCKLEAELLTWAQIATNNAICADLQPDIIRAGRITQTGRLIRVGEHQFLKTGCGTFDRFIVHTSDAQMFDLCTKFADDGSFVICFTDEINTENNLITIQSTPFIRITNRALLSGVYPFELLSAAMASYFLNKLQEKK